MNTKYRIFAGTHAQARLIANGMKLNRSAWEYVQSEYSIMGLRGGTLLCCGAWVDRPDRDRIMHRAKANEMYILMASGHPAEPADTIRARGQA